MPKAVGFGVVGLGMGLYHCHAVARARGARLVAACDTDKARLSAAVERFECRGYAHWAEMLEDPAIDCVNICVESGKHAQFGSEAARAGKHIVVEKPVDVTVAAIDRLEVAVRRAGVKAGCIFQSRVEPLNVALKRALDQGKMGTIFGVHALLPWWRAQDYYEGPHGSLLVVVALLGACSQQAREAAVYSEPELDGAVRTEALGRRTVQQDAVSLAESAMGTATSPPAAAAPGTSTLEATQPDRYLIKNASVLVEVAQARQAADEVAAEAQAIDGYISNMRDLTDELGRRAVTMQVRVPAAQFDRLVLTLDSLGTVLDRQINTEDVTEEFVDLEAALRNARQTEQRLLDHLNRTARLEDILSVERELARVRGEIERFEGRQRFLGHRIAYSTLTLTLREAAKAQPIAPARAYSVGEVFTAAIRSLVVFLRGLLAVVIWVGVWGILWLPLVLLLVLLTRRIRRRRRAVLAPPPLPSQHVAE